MGTREQVLALFEENRGIYFSGEELAGRLGVSRAAVWKAVGALRGEGYEIAAVRNRGYCLAAGTDILSAPGIRKYLGPACGGLDLQVLETAGSTNALARERAAAGAPEGCVILANAQTAGRGRVGRSFVSPPGTGLYLSLLLRPEGWPPSRAVKLTTMAAVAACEAIEAVSRREARIKWVNDIFLEGRKVSGILTEGAFGLEDGLLEYAVVGIGINVYPPEGGFPGELADTAGTVFPGPRDDGKNRLAAELLNRLMDCYAGPGGRECTRRYRERSLVVGREIDVLTPGGRRRALALDVDEECRLVVRYQDGETARLSSGEVSVRPV